MNTPFTPPARRLPPSLGSAVLRAAVLVLPFVLLLICSLRTTGETALLLWLGTTVQALGVVLTLLTRRRVREPVAPAVLMLYVIALSWLLLSVGNDDPVASLARGLLLIVPLGFFAVQCLSDSGAHDLRKARQLVRHLQTRREWPAELERCRHLPEVKALREALYADAAPVMPLLNSKVPQVRVAALAALEFREDWRPGQDEAVLRVAQRAVEPEVRAAAVYALANGGERPLVEALAASLYDPAPLVRRSAAEALLWRVEGRWYWIRGAVRLALADPACQADGPLRREGHLLPAEAVTDLTAWSGEKGNLGARAALTLGAHYAQTLAVAVEPALVQDLRRQVGDPKAAAVLRLELARLLQQYDELDADSLQRLLDPSNPAPLRLIAVDVLLRRDDSVEALAALYELARLPNREMALATAEVVQARLGVDLGVPPGGPPPVGSRHASEIARRLLQWANHEESGEEDAPASWAAPADEA